MIEGYAVPDFISDFWSYYIAAITAAGILFSLWLLKSQSSVKPLAPGEQAELMHPVWDGDLQELNNPLPRWWMWLFYLLILFGIVYLVIFPGMGKYAGTLNAGFHMLVPFVDVIRYRHTLKEQTIEIPAQICITRDNVQVHVDGDYARHPQLPEPQPRQKLTHPTQNPPPRTAEERRVWK